MTRLVLSGPTTPATRAAMLRILADQPGLRLERGVTDPIGRSGAAIVSADGAKTGYESSGWVEKIGDRP